MRARVAEQGHLDEGKGGRQGHLDEGKGSRARAGQGQGKGRVLAVAARQE